MRKSTPFNKRIILIVIIVAVIVLAVVIVSIAGPTLINALIKMHKGN